MHYYAFLAISDHFAINQLHGGTAILYFFMTFCITVIKYFDLSGICWMILKKKKLMYGSIQFSYFGFLSIIWFFKCSTFICENYTCIHHIHTCLNISVLQVSHRDLPKFKSDEPINLFILASHCCLTIIPEKRHHLPHNCTDNIIHWNTDLQWIW